jgi:3-methyladenine DNA glycosylase AlkD
MINPFHHEILQLIKENSGTAIRHTFSDSYLGNTRPRYPINAPTLRKIAKGWMREHRDLSADNFSDMITSLIYGKSSTEKCMAGIVMDYATASQRKFDIKVFELWLDQLEGWAEVDAVCTGEYTIHEIPLNWKKWKRLLNEFAKSDNINKRRASIVLLCSPLRHSKDKELAQLALNNVDRLKNEKHILITKAVSWVLRSMIKHHKQIVSEYLEDNQKTLPAIAVRETRVKLRTGKKTKIAKKPKR